MSNLYVYPDYWDVGYAEGEVDDWINPRRRRRLRLR